MGAKNSTAKTFKNLEKLLEDEREKDKHKPTKKDSEHDKHNKPKGGCNQCQLKKK
jgi:hypothetical protein